MLVPMAMAPAPTAPPRSEQHSASATTRPCGMLLLRLRMLRLLRHLVERLPPLIAAGLTALRFIPVLRIVVIFIGMESVVFVHDKHSFDHISQEPRRAAASGFAAVPLFFFLATL